MDQWQTRGMRNSPRYRRLLSVLYWRLREKAEQISRVSAEYDKAVIKNLIGLIGVLDKLGEYFSESARARLTDITTLKSGLEKQHEEYRDSEEADRQPDKYAEYPRLLTAFSASTNVKAALEACRLRREVFPGAAVG